MIVNQLRYPYVQTCIIKRDIFPATHHWILSRHHGHTRHRPSHLIYDTHIQIFLGNNRTSMRNFILWMGNFNLSAVYTTQYHIISHTLQYGEWAMLQLLPTNLLPSASTSSQSFHPSHRKSSGLMLISPIQLGPSHRFNPFYPTHLSIIPPGAISIYNDLWLIWPWFSLIATRD